MKRLIARCFPRYWSLIATGGIEVRRVIPGALYHWKVFSRVRAGGLILPIDTFGQRPLASGFARDEMGARFAAGNKLADLRRGRPNE